MDFTIHQILYSLFFTTKRIKKLYNRKLLTSLSSPHFKELLHQTLKPLRSLEKKQSTSSLNIQLACNPWFDVTKLRQSIIRDSIGNIKATRDKFEQLSKSNNLLNINM